MKGPAWAAVTQAMKQLWIMHTIEDTNLVIIEGQAALTSHGGTRATKTFNQLKKGWNGLFQTDRVEATESKNSLWRWNGLKKQQLQGKLAWHNGLFLHRKVIMEQGGLIWHWQLKKWSIVLVMGKTDPLMVPTTMSQCPFRQGNGMEFPLYSTYFSGNKKRKEFMTDWSQGSNEHSSCKLRLTISNGRVVIWIQWELWVTTLVIVNKLHKPYLLAKPYWSNTNTNM